MESPTLVGGLPFRRPKSPQAEHGVTERKSSFETTHVRPTAAARAEQTLILEAATAEAETADTEAISDVRERISTHESQRPPSPVEAFNSYAEASALNVKRLSDELDRRISEEKPGDMVYFEGQLTAQREYLLKLQEYANRSIPLGEAGGGNETIYNTLIAIEASLERAGAYLRTLQTKGYTDRSKRPGQIENRAS